jgi:hypothetical protein
MTEPTTYQLSNLTDKQWDKQLESQRLLHAAELKSQEAIELERLRNARELVRGRRTLIQGILTGLAVFLVVVLFLGGTIYAIHSDNVRDQEKAVECIKGGGEWKEGSGSREGDSCERP